MKKLLNIILFFSLLLMGLLALCVWNPDVKDGLWQLLSEADALEADILDADFTGNSVETDDGQTGDEQSDGEDEEARDTAVETEEADAQPDESAFYVAPELSELSVPEEVTGRSGRQELEETDSQVGDEEARELEERLGTGETGDGLTFDPLYYPYYDMLDDGEQHIYRQIYANAMALNPAFSPVESVTAGELRNIISAVYNDHPELFWLDTSYACKRRGNGQCVEIDLEFNRTADNLESENATFERAAEAITAEADNLGDDYDKERYVHDALIQAVDYDRSAEMSQSAYSALVNGRTVCAGYARAFQYLMQQLGVPCYYCTGYAGESHAWDIIKLDDGYYNVDPTWDDTDGGTYDYFNKTDDDYADTHVREELSVYLPPCNGSKYRTENVSAEDKGRRSLEDAGFSEEEIIRSLSDYYDECYAEIAEHGPGDWEFSNVLEGSELFDEWEAAYNTESYKQEYLIEAMRAIGAKSCHLNLNIERLQQDRYLITHDLQLQ